MAVLVGDEVALGHEAELGHLAALEAAPQVVRHPERQCLKSEIVILQESSKEWKHSRKHSSEAHGQGSFRGALGWNKGRSHQSDKSDGGRKLVHPHLN